MWLIFFFFFQAEDGIRDADVTGVQTCALPILAEREIFGDSYFYWKLYDSAIKLKKVSDNNKGEALTDPKASSLTFYEKGARSEERRVGKECRSRWWPDH